MIIYDISGYIWNRGRILAPNFKDNSYFYTVYNDKIIAITIKNSYLKFTDLDELNLYAQFETPLKNTIFDSIGYLYIDSNSNIKLHTNFSDFSIYNTVYDAKNNCKCKSIIDISKYDVLNKGYEYGKISCCGCRYYVEAYYWEYYQSSLEPFRKTITADSFIWNDNKLLLAKDGVPIPDKTWATKEEVLRYLANKNQNLEVVSFDNIDTKPEVKTFNINIEVNTNMSLEEITNIVSKKLDSFKN